MSARNNAIWIPILVAAAASSALAQVTTTITAATDLVVTAGPQSNSIPAGNS